MKQNKNKNKKTLCLNYIYIDHHLLNKLIYHNWVKKTQLNIVVEQPTQWTNSASSWMFWTNHTSLHKSSCKTPSRSNYSLPILLCILVSIHNFSVYFYNYIKYYLKTRIRFVTCSPSNVVVRIDYYVSVSFLCSFYLPNSCFNNYGLQVFDTYRYKANPLSIRNTPSLTEANFN